MQKCVTAILVSLFAALVVIALAADSEPPATVPRVTALATYTPAPTATPEPTPAPEPTATPEPTPTPTPEPTPTPYVPYGSFTRASLRPYLAAYPWPVEQALAIVFGPTLKCPNGESSGNPYADNGQDRGLFQINRVHAPRFARRGWTWDDAFVPERNIAIAYEIWSESGWSPWSCWP